MLKKQNYNQLFDLKKIVILNSLVAIFATGLFAVSTQGKYLSTNKDSKLLLKPLNSLNDEQYDKFILGRSFFAIPWVEAPSATTARDGLGPLFSANTCVSCHPSNGRGVLFKNDLPSRSLVARLSIDSNGSKEHKDILKKDGFIAHDIYGSQLSINGIHGVPFEGKVKVEFQERIVKFPDGEIETLLKPKYSLDNLNYGALDDANISYRMAPSLNGMPLIELISKKDILKNIDIEDKNNDGISGKANFVYSKITNQMELGIYTWKASVSSLKEQVANAAISDMGITTTIHKNDNCTSFQEECNNAPKSRDKIDLTDERLDAITYYLKHIKSYSAKRDKKFKEGLEVFEQISCSKCHISSFDTKKGFKVYPYSDFLLHDMGEELADGRVEFNASKSEFRTAPLWGLALHEKINKQKPRLLHDGRARTFQEAILWHGGEAEFSKENYMNLPKEKREKLIEFLKGL